MESDGHAPGRDRISKYLHGKSFPENRTIGLLCAALNVTPDQLIPPDIMQAIESIASSKILFEIDKNGTTCRFKADTRLPVSVGKKIFDILAAHAANGKVAK